MDSVKQHIHVDKKKRIALVAHDHKKDDLMAWIEKNRDRLAAHSLCGTGTTGTMIHERFGLDVDTYLSGPMGGDQQIGAEIASAQVDILIFFWDPLEAQPHDPDVRALLRIAVLYDAVIAMNPATADWIFQSEFVDETYTRHPVSPQKNLKERVAQLSHKEA